MSPRAFRNSLWLVSSIAVLTNCSVEFFIGQEYDQCSRNNKTIACLDNTNRGGLCAYAPDSSVLWCCPAPDRSCWTFGSSCTGGSAGAPGPGQISCSNEGTQWCCDEKYEVCTQAAGQINVCITNFANANANVTIAEANAIESSSTSGNSPGATSLSTTSSTSSTTPSTTSSFLPVSSPSTSPGASKPSSGLASGAISGIVIGAVVVISLIVGLLIYGIMRIKRRESTETKSTLRLEGNGDSVIGSGLKGLELDGKRLDSELPSQEMRHEMI
ncbi:hypothetical protein ABVK25_012172 [Lepraria finkii]|uniref:Mid2 domain-containing protein n=1 Tax=Lepraria finkii TaxID=1340010 RepID=A0ABR4AIM6_9LECA